MPLEFVGVVDAGLWRARRTGLAEVTLCTTIHRPLAATTVISSHLMVLALAVEQGGVGAWCRKHVQLLTGQGALALV